MSTPEHIVVAMSGGVDSSVAAALLVEQGYQVTGVMMRLWSEPGTESYNRCCTPDALVLARQIADQLGIPFQVVDAREVFRETVVQSFIHDYAQGLTPNPCLVCNRHVRWGFLLEQTSRFGADFLATGHYARTRLSEEDKIQLLRGLDPEKDQSYVLHGLTQAQLSRTRFPIGEYTKSQVRELAHRFGLPAAETPDSQDLCFLGGEDYRQFLLRHVPQVEAPGPIITQDGLKLGEHNGLAFYTIGQRKGLGIAAPYPLYVMGKDLARNVLIVGRAEELGRDELVAGQVNWIRGQPPSEAIRTEVKIRYKAHFTWATVKPLPDQRAHIKFDQSLRDITPGQAAVFYDGEVCLGGGTIEA
jgi:tRNA-specific 2-thiouridylase